MKREWKGALIGGILLVTILVILSIIFINLPCKPYYAAGGFFGTACQNDLLFTLINLPGAIIIKLLTGINTYQSSIIKLLVIVINIPIYFIIGFLLGKIFKNRKQKQ